MAVHFVDVPLFAGHVYHESNNYQIFETKLPTAPTSHLLYHSHFHHSAALPYISSAFI